MRVIVLGAGGVGGVLGGRLHQHGYDVVLIARGAHFEALSGSGLRLEDPDHSVTLAVPVVGSPADIDFQAGDVVVVATKTQDVAAALTELRAAASSSTPVFCATNGVEAERLATRFFSNVYAINVLMPTAFLHPGVVQVISAPIAGALDVGRYPSGVDVVAEEFSVQLNNSGFVSNARPDIQRAKYRKLIMNCGNAVEAACGNKSDDAKELIRRAQAEAERLLLAAKIDVAPQADEAPKQALMSYRPVNGKHRGGGSTWQSLATGRPTEVDYLNGEIVLIARHLNQAAPVNELLQHTVRQLAATASPPESVDPATLLAQLD